MSDKFKICLFTTIDSPMLTLFIDSLLNCKFKDIVVICDSKKITNKNRRIWIERTGEKFIEIDKINENIYQMASSMIPFYFVNNHNDEETLNLINFLSVDVILNAGTPRKLKKNILETPKYGAVNIHPGILPYYRGCSVVEWALLNNDKIGNTAHFMTEGYDEGNIILTDEYEFSSNSDYNSIRLKVYKESAILAGKALKLIFDKKLSVNDGIPQNNKLAKYWEPISDEKLINLIELVNKGKYKYQKL